MEVAERLLRIIFYQTAEDLEHPTCKLMRGRWDCWVWPQGVWGGLRIAPNHGMARKREEAPREGSRSSGRWGGGYSFPLPELCCMHWQTKKLNWIFIFVLQHNALKQSRSNALMFQESSTVDLEISLLSFSQQQRVFSQIQLFHSFCGLLYPHHSYQDSRFCPVFLKSSICSFSSMFTMRNLTLKVNLKTSTCACSHWLDIQHPP